MNTQIFVDTPSEDKAILGEKNSISGLKFRTFCNLLHLPNNIQQNTLIPKYANLKIPQSQNTPISKYANLKYAFILFFIYPVVHSAHEGCNGFSSSELSPR